MNPLNDISKVYLEQVAASNVEIEEGMTMKDFKANRRKLKRREASADAKKRGHVGKEWYNSGRTYSPDEAKSGRANMPDHERQTRHRSAVDPDNDNDDMYSADKTKNPKKLRKQKAMGELGESAVPGKPAERLGAVTAIPKAEQEAARERVLAKAKAMREKNLTKEALDPVGKEDADVDNDGKKGTNADKYLMKRRKAIGKAISTQEAKEVKRWWDDDGDGKGYEEGEVSGKFKKKKVKESFSNWRQDLVEIISDTDSEDNKKIKEKKVNNKITINPNLKESVEGLGGILLEMVEIDEVDYIVESVYDELIDEGYEEDDIEEAIEYALTEAKVTFGHDTPTGQKKRGNLVKAVGRLARQKLSSKVRGAKKAAAGAVARGARKVAKGALGVARKMEGGDKKPHTAARKPSTYRGAGAGQKEKVSSGSYTPPTKKKAEKPADPWEGSATTPPKAKAKPKAATKKAAAPKAKAPAATKRKRKSKLDDLLASVRSESVIGDRARNAVADQRLDDAQRETQKSVDKVKSGDRVTRSSASIAANKSERTARAMHPKPGVGGYRIEKPKPTGSKASGYRIEATQIDEKTLSAAETKEKERLVKSMKSKASDFEKRYPGRGKEVMYATATKMAKKMAEQAMELQPKTQPAKGEDPKARAAAQRAKSAEINILQKRLQAIRQTPAGTPVSGIGG
jgi:hypothetical protein